MLRVTATLNVVDANMGVRDQRTLFIYPCACLPRSTIIVHTHPLLSLMFTAAARVR